jgi:hypothetical protein
MTPLRALLLVAALLAGLVAVPAQAAETTRCVFGGAVPGYRALRVELPAGSDFLTLELHGQRNVRPVVDESSWHLAEGIAVIDATTREIVAYQVLNAGTAPPVVVAETDGTQHVRQPLAGPEGPWIHSGRKAPPSLPPGTYDIVAFGTGGPRQGANAQTWGASIYLRGAHPCSSTTAGETFDFNHTHFSGGTQVYAAGVGTAEDVSLAFETDRPLVVGLIDAGFQGQEAGEVTLAYDLAGQTGSLGRETVPFVAGPGTHTFTASYRGLHPIVNVAGVALDLPALDATGGQE